MTTSVVTPSKAKTWVGFVGAVLTALVPYVLTISTSLPEPWPAAVGGAIALLTALGVYNAPYKPTDTVLVPVDQAPPAYTPTPTAGGGTWRNPWRS